MKLAWSAFAVEDRDQIFDFIALENPMAAIRCDREISEQTIQLIDFPEMGRPGRVKGTRELVVQRTPFLVAYQVGQEEIRILRVLHGTQMWPDALEHSRDNDGPIS